MNGVYASTRSIARVSTAGSVASGRLGAGDRVGCAFVVWVGACGGRLARAACPAEREPVPEDVATATRTTIATTIASTTASRIRPARRARRRAAGVRRRDPRPWEPGSSGDRGTGPRYPPRRPAPGPARTARGSAQAGRQPTCAHVGDRLDRDLRVDARRGREARAVHHVQVAHVPGLAGRVA